MPKFFNTAVVITETLFVFFIMCMLSGGCLTDEHSTGKYPHSKETEAAFKAIEEEIANKPSKRLAYVAAESAVTTFLKSPASAKFPDYWNTDRVVSMSGNTYTINSIVDSQNGFGALIRTTWFIQMTWNGGDNNGWYITDYTITKLKIGDTTLL